MESSEHNVAYISPPICTNRLIFSKWTFFISLFLNMPTYPIIFTNFNFCDVTPLLSIVPVTLLRHGHLLHSSYPWHKDHKLDHKASKSLKGVSHKFHVTKRTFLASLELRVEEVQKVTELSPWRFLNSAISKRKSETTSDFPFYWQLCPVQKRRIGETALRNWRRERLTID